VIDGESEGGDCDEVICAIWVKQEKSERDKVEEKICRTVRPSVTSKKGRSCCDWRPCVCNV